MAEFYTRFIRETMDEAYQVTPMVLPVRRGLQLRLRRHRPLGDLDPHRLAMLWRNHRGGKRLTFSDLKTLSNQAANLLRSHGLQKGDVVMTALRTHWSYWIVALAAHKLGLLLAPVYYRLTAEDFRYRMEKAKVRCVVTCREGPAAENIWAAAEQAQVPLRFALGPGEDGFLDLLAALPQQPDTLDRVPTLATDPLLLYFTSGTTGLPKGVLHDHAFPWPTTGGPVHAGRPQGLPPLRHRGHRVGGGLRHQVLRPVAPPGDSAGVRLRPLPPEQVLAFLAEAKATSIMAQPSVYRLLTQVGMDRYDLSSITNYAVGGEKLLPDLAQTVTQQTGHVLYEGYAQSERPHRLGLPGDGAEGGLPWGKSCPSTTWRSSERTAPSPPGEQGRSSWWPTA